MPEQLDVRFLKRFASLITTYVRAGRRFIIIVGGGKIARHYQAAAKRVTKLTREDLDWLGIHATRLNAHLLRTVFRTYAYSRIITNRRKIHPRVRQPIVIAAGFTPGSSTDYNAVLLARAYKATTILNLSNIDWVYDADPRTHAHAKPLQTMTWKAFQKLVGTTWDPGANVPFDPVASRWAARWKMRVIITRGTDFANLRKLLDDRAARGTVISN